MGYDESTAGELLSALVIALRRTAALAAVLVGGWLIFMSATTGTADTRLTTLAVGYLVGGGVLLAAGRWRLPLAWSAGVCAVAGPAGTLLGLLVRVEGSAAMFSWTERRGFPLHATHRAAAGETVGAARAAVRSAPWRADWLHAVADLAFWGLCGLALVAAVTLVVRRVRRPSAE